MFIMFLEVAHKILKGENQKEGRKHWKRGKSIVFVKDTILLEKKKEAISKKEAELMRECRKFVRFNPI